MDLFSTTEAASPAPDDPQQAVDPLDPFGADAARANGPLAWRMRPRTLAEYMGQEHLLGEGKLLRRQLDSGRLNSVILYGPPGCGKTALAHLLARELKRPFTELNAVTAGVADVRKVVAQATAQQRAGQAGVLLFIDEIHRFNKTQQSALLPHVEQGLLTLIGASTQNPFFAIIPPLASRSHIVAMEPVSEASMARIVDAAINDPDRGLGAAPVVLDDDARSFLLARTEGDARRTLNALETAHATTPPDDKGVRHISLEVMAECLGEKPVVYDDGDAHYDTASALIKSIRGSDPDASLYWLAKMLIAGEDPLFITRRLMIAASEDIGNADPRALPLAVATHEAVLSMGLPEGRIPLAQTTVYLAVAPKSNAAYKALDAAIADIKNGTVLPVPMHLRDRHYSGAKSLGHGEGYLYPHDYPDHLVAQDYLGAERSYYHPTRQGFEARISDRLDAIEAALKKASPDDGPPP